VSAVRSRLKLKVALTFDDGPARRTPQILDVLARNGARATFFVVGDRIPGREHILQRAIAEGHELGNHTDTHPRISLLSDDEIAAELRRTNDRVHAAAAVTPRLVRPPYGGQPRRVAAVAAQLGFAATVLWSVNPQDWLRRRATEVSGPVLANTKPGAIVLLHHHAVTVEALPTIVAGLHELLGYELVTVSELLSELDMEPGQLVLAAGKTH
jgi:peptidoglycan/xylan/chitin deacetylase (PgdA/CDA1 family)